MNLRIYFLCSTTYYITFFLSSKDNFSDFQIFFINLRVTAHVCTCMSLPQADNEGAHIKKLLFFGRKSGMLY